MMTVTIIKKQKIKKLGWICLKTWVGIFQVGVFREGGGVLMGGNFPGGSFPDTIFCLVKKCMKFRRSVQVLL